MRELIELLKDGHARTQAMAPVTAAVVTAVHAFLKEALRIWEKCTR